MATMDFPGNSREPRRPVEDAKPDGEKKILKVVGDDVKVIRRKKPLGVRFKEMFLGGETINQVAERVVADILVPAAKDMMADALRETIERMLWGDRGRRTTNTRGGSSGVFGGGGSNHTPYHRMSSRDDRSRPPAPSLSRRGRANHEFDEIILPTRVYADNVLEQMYTILEQYEVVTVRDLYELVGETHHFTDNDWGWTDLRGSDVRRVSNGYLLDLPKPDPVNR